MTLDEAIAHADDRAADADCECREDHAQLALWLRELRTLRLALWLRELRTLRAELNEAIRERDEAIRERDEAIRERDETPKRDPEHPCPEFIHGTPRGTGHDCDGDGHYMCCECVHFNAAEAAETAEREAERQKTLEAHTAEHPGGGR